jgi:hypothetical protein
MYYVVLICICIHDKTEMLRQQQLNGIRHFLNIGGADITILKIEAGMLIRKIKGEDTHAIILVMFYGGICSMTSTQTRRRGAEIVYNGNKARSTVIKLTNLAESLTRDGCTRLCEYD